MRSSPPEGLRPAHAARSPPAQEARLRRTGEREGPRQTQGDPEQGCRRGPGHYLSEHLSAAVALPRRRVGYNPGHLGGRVRVLVGLLLCFFSTRLGTAGPPHGSFAAPGSGVSAGGSATAARRVGDGSQQLHLHAAVPPVSHQTLQSPLPTYSQHRAVPGSPLYLAESPAPPSGPTPPCGPAPPPAAQNGPVRLWVKPPCSRGGSAQSIATAACSHPRLERGERKVGAGRALLPWPLLTRGGFPPQPQARALGAV